MNDDLKAQLDELDDDAKAEVIAYLGGGTAHPNSGGGPGGSPTPGPGGHQ